MGKRGTPRRNPLRSTAVQASGFQTPAALFSRSPVGKHGVCCGQMDCSHLPLSGTSPTWQGQCSSCGRTDQNVPELELSRLGPPELSSQSSHCTHWNGKILCHCLPLMDSQSCVPCPLSITHRLPERPPPSPGSSWAPRPIAPLAASMNSGCFVYKMGIRAPSPQGDHPFVHSTKLSTNHVLIQP